jgi:cold shock CspA family protein
MYSGTVLWYNPGNRFALIKRDNGNPPYLAQLTPEQAISNPLSAGQRFETHPADAEGAASTRSLQGDRASTHPT